MHPSEATMEQLREQGGNENIHQISERPSNTGFESTEKTMEPDEVELGEKEHGTSKAVGKKKMKKRKKQKKKEGKDVKQRKSEEAGVRHQANKTRKQTCRQNSTEKGKDSPLTKSYRLVLGVHTLPEHKEQRCSIRQELLFPP